MRTLLREKVFFRHLLVMCSVEIDPPDPAADLRRIQNHPFAAPTSPACIGRQRHSFEVDLDVQGFNGGPLRAVFIRAPWVDEAGEVVEVLAEVDGHPVAVRQDNVLAVAFHPEIAGDPRVHTWVVRG